MNARDIIQYIGARYVPKFMGEYNPSQEYEALSVVDNGLGTSYISKIPTPAGTSLTNTDYWHLYGSSSGAIINLQNQIDLLREGFATPQMYGAKADGSTDDTRAIQDCILNNNFVLIPEGDYITSAPIELHSNLTIIGRGKIICSWDDNQTTDYMGVFYGDNLDSVDLAGLSIEATTPSSTSSYVMYSGCIVFNSSNNITIKDCNLKNIPYISAIGARSCNNVLIENCTIDTFVYGGVVFSEGTSNAAVINCLIKNPVTRTYANSYPITLNSYDHTYDPLTDVIGQNLKCIGNTIICDFPWWEGIDFHGGNNIVVTDNIVIGAMCGISCAGSVKANHVTISNNICIGNKDSDVTRAAVNSGISIALADDVIVTNNIIKDFGHNAAGLSTVSSGIYISRSTDVFIEGNTFDNCYNENIESYILYSSESGEIIKNNYFKNSNALYVYKIIDTLSAHFHEFCFNTIEGAAQNFVHAHSMTHRGYSVIHDNNSDVHLISLSDYIVPEWSTSPTNTKVGRISDIIKNINPSSGMPLIWICTSASDENNDAVWSTKPAPPKPNIV